jgi:hypothetical protein
MSEQIELPPPEELPEEIRRLIERPPQEKLPEKPLRLKNIVITFIYVWSVYLKPEEVREFLRVFGKGSLNYLLKSAAELRELMRKEEFRIEAIEFPAEKYEITEKALIEAKKTLKGKKNKQAKKLVDELLKIEKGKPLIIAQKGAEPFVEKLYILETTVLAPSYRDSLPYLRVEGSFEKISFESILETFLEALETLKKLGYLREEFVAALKESVTVLRGWVSPDTILRIKPVLRLHGGFPAYTLIVMVEFSPEVELEVHQVNVLTRVLYDAMLFVGSILFIKRPVMLFVGSDLFIKRPGVFPGKLKEVFESVLTMIRYVGGTYGIFADLEFDKSFEELVKTCPRQVESLARMKVDWWNEGLRDAEKYIKEFSVEVSMDGVILSGVSCVVLHRANTLRERWISYNLPAILAYDLAITATWIIHRLIDSLRGGEFDYDVLVGLREYVTRLLGELGGYYRLAFTGPFRDIWRNIYRVRELHRAEGELKELLSAIDRRLKRVEERRFSVMSILLGTLGVFGALEFILGVFSLWGINTYTIIAAGTVALTITLLLSWVIRHMRK